MVHLSREPGDNESPFNFTLDFEMQLGVESQEEVYAECPYEDCDGNMLDFHWWEGSPEQPEEGVLYPLYPE